MLPDPEQVAVNAAIAKERSEARKSTGWLRFWQKDLHMARAAVGTDEDGPPENGGSQPATVGGGKETSKRSGGGVIQSGHVDQQPPAQAGDSKPTASGHRAGSRGGVSGGGSIGAVLRAIEADVEAGLRAGAAGSGGGFKIGGEMGRRRRGGREGGAARDNEGVSKGDVGVDDEAEGGSVGAGVEEPLGEKRGRERPKKAREEEGSQLSYEEVAVGAKRGGGRPKKPREEEGSQLEEEEEAPRRAKKRHVVGQDDEADAAGVPVLKTRGKGAQKHDRATKGKDAVGALASQRGSRQGPSASEGDAGQRAASKVPTKKSTAARGAGRGPPEDRVYHGSTGEWGGYDQVALIAKATASG